MKPDYVSKNGKIKLYNMDCMDYLAQCSDNEFDLAVVDPPYGLPQRSGKGAGKLADRQIQNMHKKGWDVSPKPDYFNQLTRSGKQQIIWGGNYFGLPPTRGFIVWDKVQPWPNFSDCEFAWNSIDGVARIFKYDNRQDKKQHPTQKPVKLYQWILDNYAKPEHRILDTHLGSGSSAIAAHYFGCEFVGIELDKDYFEASVKRFEQETAQIDMFSGAA